MKLEKKKARDIGDAKNVQNSMNGTTKSAERKYSISLLSNKKGQFDL